MVVKVSADGFAGFNRAADNNKDVILRHLQRLVVDYAEVLEIGSGSGQHVVHFGVNMPGVRWQPTDRGAYYDLLLGNMDSVSLSNVYAPRYLDIADFPDLGTYDAAYCANVCHIMPEALIEPMCRGVSRSLAVGGRFIVYGPFRYDGAFTTPSNEQFDDWLRSRDPLSGIRDIELIQERAGACGLVQVEDNPMPANNQLLVFEKC